MAQFLRPDSNVTQTSFTNGFAAIDESVASDVDFAFGANNTAAVLEVGLSNPAGTPTSGITTVRYRIAKTNAGVVNGSGNSVTVTCSVRQGANVIATDTARTATGTWTEYSFTPNMSAVTDWNDVRLRFTTSQSGGTTANRRGGAVSWAELEAPDASQATEHQGAFAASGAGGFTAVGGKLFTGSFASTGSGSFGASGFKALLAGMASFSSGTASLIGRLTAKGTAAQGGVGSFAASGQIQGQGPPPSVRRGPMSLSLSRKNIGF